MTELKAQTTLGEWATRIAKDAMMQRAALERDAARYRWIKENVMVGSDDYMSDWWEINRGAGATFEEDIDLSMKGHP